MYSDGEWLPQLSTQVWHHVTTTWRQRLAHAPRRGSVTRVDATGLVSRKSRASRRATKTCVTATRGVRRPRCSVAGACCRSLPNARLTASATCCLAGTWTEYQVRNWRLHEWCRQTIHATYDKCKSFAGKVSLRLHWSSIFAFNKCPETAQHYFGELRVAEYRRSPRENFRAQFLVYHFATLVPVTLPWNYVGLWYLDLARIGLVLNAIVSADTTQLGKLFYLFTATITTKLP